MKNIKTYVFSLGMVFLLAACNGNNPVGPTSIESQESSQSANQGINLIAPEEEYPYEEFNPYEEKLA